MKNLFLIAAAEIAAKSGKSLQEALETLWRKKLNQAGVSVIGKPPELPWRELIDEFWAGACLAVEAMRSKTEMQQKAKNYWSDGFYYIRILAFKD